MKELFTNNDNLKKEEIDEKVVRTKALIINSKNELLLGYAHNIYQFPGGHLENNENINDCLEREIKEELGIEMNLCDNSPFMKIKYYTKNYFNSGKNRCNVIYYYIINSDEEINLKNTNYTKEEKEGNYVARYINLEDVEMELIDNANKYPKCKLITCEMLSVIDEFKKTLVNV